MADNSNRNHCIKLYNQLSPEDKKFVRGKIINSKQKRNKKYRDVIPRVERYLMLNGTITKREAFELGFTDEELDTTTFRRCIISKLTIEISTKPLPDRRLCYYLKGMDSIDQLTEYTTVGHKLVNSILSSVDFSQKTVNLRSFLDSERYPLLEDSENLSRLGPMLVEEMMRRGYTRSSRNLDFTREV